jgi:hypothetical protein
MKTHSGHLTVSNGSRYVLIPFYVVYEYELKGTEKVEFDKTDPDTLVIKVKKTKGQ